MFGRGELSYSKVRAKRRQRYARRSQTTDVMIEMQLPPEEAAIVWDAMMSAADAISEASAEASEQASAEASERSSAELDLRWSLDRLLLAEQA